MRSKPKLLIIADQPHWAYHNIQLFLKRQFSHKIDIYTDFVIFNNQKDPGSLLPHHLLKRKIDEIRFRRVRNDKKYDAVLYLGVYFTDLMNSEFSAKTVLKGIYTDGFPPQSIDSSEFQMTNNDFFIKYLQDTDLIVCGSQMICDYYKDFFPNTFYANAAYNENLFCGKKIIEKNNSKEFNIGWTGNPNRKFKGFFDIVVPAVEEASKIRQGIELKTRFSGPLKTLPDFYKDIDLILIASDRDAGPSLFMEASLMNVPSVSTRIGMPHEVILDGVNGLFCEKNVSSFVEAILKLYDDRDLLFEMSKCIRNDTIQILGLDISVHRWNEVFARAGLC